MTDVDPRRMVDPLRSHGGRRDPVGVRTGALTWGEADELLSRLRVIVDQALDRWPQFS